MKVRGLNSFQFIGLTALFILISGCSHVAHRAGVEPGPNVSVLYGRSYERYDPPRQWEDPSEKLSGYGLSALQVNWGHAWRLKNGDKFLLQGVFAPIQSTPYFLPSLDMYWQFSSQPQYSDGGFGTILGLDPMLYFLWGRDFIGRYNGKFSSGVDVGMGIAAGWSFLGQVTWSVKYGSMQAGIGAEYRYYTQVLNLCVDNCGYDAYIRTRWVFSIIITRLPSN